MRGALILPIQMKFDPIVKVVNVAWWNVPSLWFNGGKLFRVVSLHDPYNMAICYRASAWRNT